MVKFEIMLSEVLMLLTFPTLCSSSCHSLLPLELLALHHKWFVIVAATACRFPIVSANWNWNMHISEFFVPELSVLTSPIG